MLARASGDMTAALLDFKTRKKLYTENISDGSNFSLQINKASSSFPSILQGMLSSSKTKLNLIIRAEERPQRNIGRINFGGDDD